MNLYSRLPILRKFGERPGRKRKATRTAQFYTMPFRPESYCKPIRKVEQFLRGLGTFLSTKLNEIPAENGVGAAFVSGASQLT